MDSCKGLPAVSLLNSYMDIILSASRKQVITLTCISKGVERVEVLDRTLKLEGKRKPKDQFVLYMALGSGLYCAEASTASHKTNGTSLVFVPLS